jgi:integrase
MVRILAGKFTRKERIRQRQAISLDDAALTDKTQERYYSALRKILPTVERARNADHMDALLCNWIRRMWKTGEPLLTIGDAWSGLHFFIPSTKRKIPHAWKLFGIWRRVEIPSRAPPLTERLVRSMAAFEVSLGNLEMAACLLLGFHCLLRTGEILALRLEDILLGSESGICTLTHTKSGLRRNAAEAVSIEDVVVLEVLRILVLHRRDTRQEALPVWSGTGAQFRQRFAFLCKNFDLSSQSFRPYSLRRGGATHLFQVSHSMELALLRGRWESTRVAKLYISDALSHLPKIRMSSKTQALLKRFYFLNAIDG